MLEDTGSRPSRERSRAIETLRKAYQCNCGSELADTWLIRRGRPTGSGRKQEEIAEKGAIRVMLWQLLSGHLSCQSFSPFMCLHFLVFSCFPPMGFSLLHMENTHVQWDLYLWMPLYTNFSGYKVASGVKFISRGSTLLCVLKAAYFKGFQWRYCSHNGSLWKFWGHHRTLNITNSVNFCVCLSDPVTHANVSCMMRFYGWCPATDHGFTQSHVTDSQSRDDVHGIYTVDRSRYAPTAFSVWYGVSAIIIFHFSSRLPHIIHLVFIIDCLFQPPTTLVWFTLGWISTFGRERRGVTLNHSQPRMKCSWRESSPSAAVTAACLIGPSPPCWHDMMGDDTQHQHVGLWCYPGPPAPQDPDRQHFIALIPRS